MGEIPASLERNGNMIYIYIRDLLIALVNSSGVLTNNVRHFDRVKHLRACERRGLDWFAVHIGQHYSYEVDRVFFEAMELHEVGRIRMSGRTRLRNRARDDI